MAGDLNHHHHAASNETYSMGGSERTPAEIAHDNYWLQKAKDCHRVSTDYLDKNIRAQWEKNLAHFNSEHAKDSKFFSANYRNRNRLFRPKTRSIELKSEAAVSRALFATSDLTSVKPTDENDLAQIISAEINQNLLQYRLTRTIPWFQTAMGAWQDTWNYGICISYQYWNFQSRVKKIPTGALTQEGEDDYRDEIEIIKNEPAIDLIPPENFRFDASADWRNPVESSTFLERLVPLPLSVVLERMESKDLKTGKPQWRKYSREQIIAASSGMDEEESIRRAREGQNRDDPHSRYNLLDDSQTIWSREYFLRDGGIDWVFWTIGDNLMLTDPVPIEEVYFHGKRPFRIGYSVIETHKAIPTSKNQMVGPLQEAINKLTNQRSDNVDLVLNKRYFLRRGQNIDTPALMRNVPGGGVYMDNPESDVKVVTTPDVTSSSYEEQNRFSNEMDEIGGNFSPSSVMSNRQLNETVGGMRMNEASSDELTEYAILIFILTWVEPALEQLMRLEQAYEDDEVVLKLAAGKSQAYKRTNLNGNIPEQLLMQELTLDVDVGIGNTDPMTKADNFMKAMGGILSIFPEARFRLDQDQVIKEIMAGAGRRDGQRFFKPLEEVQIPEQPQPGGKSPEELALMAHEIELKNEQFYAKLAQEHDLKLEQLYAQLGIKGREMEQKESLTRLIEGNKQNELMFKALTGRQGI